MRYVAGHHRHEADVELAAYRGHAVPGIAAGPLHDRRVGPDEALPEAVKDTFVRHDPLAVRRVAGDAGGPYDDAVGRERIELVRKRIRDANQAHFFRIRNLSGKTVQ